MSAGDFGFLERLIGRARLVSSLRVRSQLAEERTSLQLWTVACIAGATSLSVGDSSNSGRRFRARIGRQDQKESWRPKRVVLAV